MLRSFFLAILSGLGLAPAAKAQLTLHLTQVPANTPPNDVLYVAGSFNNWDPGTPGYQLTKSGTTYLLTLPAAVRGAIEFKFTRGSWATVETTASGAARPNRTYVVPASGAVQLDLQIAGWNDLLAPPPPTSTAAPNVSVLSQNFAIPQLGRTRRIWLYLPPDYQTTQKTYPVLYMQDGQNLFDAATSFSGEWGVDEALNQLHAGGDWGCIVVGVDNGGASRLDEYAPYPNPQYGGGQGDQYVDFLVNTLKPYIDQHYRTRPDRLHTGVMGSSMGGLISLYAALKRPDIFGRAGVFSPSLWFNRRIYTYARGVQPLRPDPRFYLLSGGHESSTQRADQLMLADSLAHAGFTRGTTGEVDTVIKTVGQHAEWFWRREFATAYQWLFRGTGPLGRGGDLGEKAAFEVFPNPLDSTHDRLTVQLLDPEAAPNHALVEILDATGRVVASDKLRHGTAKLMVRALPAGAYQVRVQTRHQPTLRPWVKL